MRGQKRDMRHQVSEINRVPDEAVQAPLHNAPVGRQQTEAAAQRDLSGNDDDEAKGCEEGRLRLGDQRRGLSRPHH